MFRKPFKIKSNTQVKSSERKNVKEQLLRLFPSLTEADIEIILPKKENLSNIKILTHNEEIVQVYSVQKRPVIFIIRKTLFPTLYLLWKYPDMIPSFTTHPNVFSNISSGADLMLPGVLTPPAISGTCRYGNYAENTVACVNSSANRAAFAVGLTVQSTRDMELANGKGRCLTVYHYFGDKLCCLEGMQSLPVVNLGPPEWLNFNQLSRDDFPPLGGHSNRLKSTNDIQETESNLNALDINVDDDNKLEVITDNDNKIDDNHDLSNETDEMDEILMHCFLKAIKYSKSLNLPILTSNFYKLQMLAVCPDNKTLDLKKSSFKKLKPFLDNMCKIGLITIKEVKKGVESIVAINQNHPDFSAFYLNIDDRPKKVEPSTSTMAASSSSNIIESFMVNQGTLPVFSDAGYKKGDIVQLLEIRKIITDYIRKNECQDPDDKKLVKMNDVLSQICKTDNKIAWGELFEKITESMKPCYKVSSSGITGGDDTVHKGKISPITISVSVRSGNKKVTLIDNLDLFGVCIPDFAKECQHGVAASTSISRPSGKKTDQLLVQGNQVLFVYNLLVDKYAIPKKYIKGLEFALKKKK